MMLIEISLCTTNADPFFREKDATAVSDATKWIPRPEMSGGLRRIRRDCWALHRDRN